MTGLASRGFPLVLAAPSGAGKTTLARALVEGEPDVAFSVSVTTRLPRSGERDGVDYRFVDRETFDAMAARGDLAEWAEVHGEGYGTPRSELEAAAERGAVIVLDIDVQGARQVRAAFPEAVTVFILPPSADSLLERLTGRGTEDREKVAVRMETALKELEAAPEFDYTVVNDRLDEAVDALRAILRAEAHRTRRATALDAVLGDLSAGVRAVLEKGSRGASGRGSGGEGGE
ncbi:MAG: guanylate kinase [Gemmatimonadota bacterium]